jgi:hypothetical protein
MMFSTADRCTVRVGSPQDFLRPLSCGYVAVRGAFPRATSRETRADHRGSGNLDGHPRCFARTGTVAAMRAWLTCPSWLLETSLRGADTRGSATRQL